MNAARAPKLTDLRQFRELPASPGNLAAFASFLRELTGADAVQIVNGTASAMERIAGAEPSEAVAANLLKTARNVILEHANADTFEQTFRFSGQLVHLLAARAQREWLLLWMRLPDDRAARIARQWLGFAIDSMPGRSGVGLTRLADAPPGEPLLPLILQEMLSAYGGRAAYVGSLAASRWRLVMAHPREVERRSELRPLLQIILSKGDDPALLARIARWHEADAARLLEPQPGTRLLLVGDTDALDRGHSAIGFAWLRLALAQADARPRRVRSGPPRWMLLVMLFCLVGLLLIPVPDRIRAPVTLEPSVRRYLAAPFNARVAEVHVQRGDRVTIGDLVITLDGREIAERIAEVESRLAAARLQNAADLEAANHASATIRALEAESLTHELAVLRQSAEQLELVAPLDGMVLSGDLDRVEGAAVEIGQPLAEVAPLDPLIAEVAVPDMEIPLVQPDLKVQIQLDAFPDQRWPTRIATIQPMAVTRDAQNVFIAECLLPNPDGLLRPGMEGRALIIAESKPLGWLLIRKPVRMIRTWLFR